MHQFAECHTLVRAALAACRDSLLFHLLFAQVLCDVPPPPNGRGLHSFTLELNLSSSRTHS